MEEKTSAFLAAAQRNQRFVDRLRFLDSSADQTSPDQLPELLWSVVVCFYAAVHFINAYMWEHDRFEPANHASRTHRVYQDPRLTPIARNYQLLREWGFRARYDPRTHISNIEVQRAVDELHAIAELVRRELGNS